MDTVDDQERPAAGPDRFLSRLFGLEGRTAVVTGATSGLGAECARALAGAGARVVAAGRDEERGRGVVEGIAEAGGEAELELVDVGRPESVAGFVERVLARHDRIDVLVNAAGVFLRGPAADATPEDWDETFRVNVTGTFLMCQAFGRHMIARGGGRIVNFGSTDGVVGVPEQAAYCASKGAVHQITRTLGAEWIRHGVAVNAIAPCDFATPMIAGALDEPEYRNWILDAIPAGRVGQPGELAGAVVFLSSGAASMVAGHTLLVDGGRTAI
jgi:NAD(P)-dependent dehydrogenase (short-subunit alcohol dehydrogenase family)